MIGPCKLFIHIFFKYNQGQILSFSHIVACTDGKPSLNPCCKVNEMKENHHLTSSDENDHAWFTLWSDGKPSWWVWWSERNLQNDGVRTFSDTPHCRHCRPIFTRFYLLIWSEWRERVCQGGRVFGRGYKGCIWSGIESKNGNFIYGFFVDEDLYLELFYIFKIPELTLCCCTTIPINSTRVAGCRTTIADDGTMKRTPCSHAQAACRCNLKDNKRTCSDCHTLAMAKSAPISNACDRDVTEALEYSLLNS